MRDLVSERIVLSGLFSGGLSGYLTLDEMLTDDCFTDPINLSLYRSMKSLYGVKEFSTIDPASLYAEIHALGFSWIFDKKDDSKYVEATLSGHVESENVLKWAVKIRKLAIARKIREEQRKALSKIESVTGDETVEEIIGFAEDPIINISKKLDVDDTDEIQKFTDGIDEWLDSIGEDQQIGISTGYKYYDTFIGGGLRRKTVSLVGARIKVGKSMYCLNVAINIVLREIPVLYLDTEMAIEEHWPRALANLCVSDGFNIESRSIESGKFLKSDKIKSILFENKEKLKGHPFYYRNIAGLNPEQIVGKIKRWIHKHVGYDENGDTKDCVVLFDYVKITDEASIKHNVAEYQALGILMTDLYLCCKKYDFPMLAFVQLNRDGIDKETSGAVAGSDRLLWTSANFAIYKNKSEEEIKEDGIESGTRKLVIMHSRHGEEMSPGDYISYQFDGRFAKISEFDTRGNMKKRLTNRVKKVEDESRFSDDQEKLQ